ncbi:MAG: Uma2 family endonuclease [Synechococcaceae cyanobacterium SM2_3_1]|nr:Uma2 family endonuclease [Synechococcaceae cyanobacterium SM2_3_1]
MIFQPHAVDDLVYPESDGNSMADNTEQFRWIVTIKENLEILFAEDPNVFVAGDLLWYPVKGSLERMAPDVLVAFGRPKGKRGSFKQWEEENIAPQVVFEILSPSNKDRRGVNSLETKFEFYDRYSVEEYYIYDPDDLILAGWLRRGEKLQPIPDMQGWGSPRLGIQFKWEVEQILKIFRPDGKQFLTPLEMEERIQNMEAQLLLTEQRADRLAERLRSLGVDPDRL